VKLPDVNVLLHLHRDEHAQHAIARTWWQDLKADCEPLTVLDLVWVSFMRLATNPRVYREPSSPEVAWRFGESIRSQGIYIEYAAHPRLLEMFGSQIRNAKASANLVTDAYIAAAAIALGATVVTFDRDFRRFDGLSVLELS
jgi:toxin-antitoxin system PIN domain toxin